MNAIILAGGNGTRLRPLTEELPKPMIPVLNKPLMEYSIDLLKKYGITDIGVTLMFLPQFIKNYFKDGSEFGVNLTYYTEDSPLGTAGSVKLAEDALDDTFVVISGDALTNIQIDKILKYHKSIDADVTIVLSKQDNPLEYGVVLTDSSGKVTSFCEKPMWESVVSNTVNTGIYIIEKKVLKKIPTDLEFDFSNDLFPLLMKENYNIYGYITEDYWCDLGNPQSYLSANTDVLSGKVFGDKYENILCEGVMLSENVKLIPPVYIGKNTVINGSCKIGPNVTIGDNSIIENSDVSDSLIWNKNLINYSNLSNIIIGENNIIDKCVFAGNNVIGSKVKLNKNSFIEYGIKISNNVEIPSDFIVTNDYNKRRNKRSLFSDEGISGIWNYEIFYQDLLGIASSYTDKKILISSNKTELSVAISDLLASFYALCGVNVYISFSNEASCRFFSSINKIKSIYIYEKNDKINIQLIDEKGLNISHKQEKSIDFNKNIISVKRGNIVRLNSIDKDFEYFLNASIPFCKENVQISTDEKFRLHNLIWENYDFNGTLNKISSASVLAKNGTISDVYDKSGRLSTNNYLRLKSDIIAFLGGKDIFLPSYASEEVVSDAKNKGLNVLKKLQHRGDSMQQASNFTDTSVLIEYVPAFFAQALAFYLSKNTFEQNNNTVIAKYDFKTVPLNTCKTIFALNKNKNTNVVRSNYKNGVITIVPHNNGCYFTAYGSFAKEEYAPDILESFISESNLEK